jgi:hypothetical protein
LAGPLFLIEYDTSQNDDNHIHTVWRDFDADFGRDLLREHHAAASGTAHRHSLGTLRSLRVPANEGVLRHVAPALHQGSREVEALTNTWPPLVRNASPRVPHRTRFAASPDTPDTDSAPSDISVAGS